MMRTKDDLQGIIRLQKQHKDSTFKVGLSQTDSCRRHEGYRDPEVGESRSASGEMRVGGARWGCLVPP